MKILTSSEILGDGNGAGQVSAEPYRASGEENAIPHIPFLFKTVTFWYIMEFLAQIFL